MLLKSSSMEGKNLFYHIINIMTSGEQTMKKVSCNSYGTDLIFLEHISFSTKIVNYAFCADNDFNQFQEQRCDKFALLSICCRNIYQIPVL